MTMIKKIVTGAVIAASSLALLGSVAQAGDYGYRGNGYGNGHSPRYGYYRPAPVQHYGYQQPRRDRTREKIATGVAIGVGALILGSILANQGHRSRY